jgi:hypothetical protein
MCILSPCPLISPSPCLLVFTAAAPYLHAIMFAGSCRSGPGDRSRAERSGRKVRTPQDSRLANGQAGKPDGRVQQRTDSPAAHASLDFISNRFDMKSSEAWVGGDGETVR